MGLTACPQRGCSPHKKAYHVLATWVWYVRNVQSLKAISTRHTGHLADPCNSSPKSSPTSTKSPLSTSTRPITRDGVGNGGESSIAFLQVQASINTRARIRTNFIMFRNYLHPDPGKAHRNQGRNYCTQNEYKFKY